MVKDWIEVDLLSLSDGGMQNGVFYEVSRKGSGIPLINVGDMYTQVPITSNSLGLFDATDEEIKRFAVNDGDLFFTRSSIVPSGIAFCNWYNKTNSKPVVFDSHVIRFKTDTNKVVSMFLYLQCVSQKARKFFIANAKTATMTTIDQAVLGKCPIDLPPLSEQCAIAAALSDTDAYIAALEKLIAKKRNIKQGAMQELLTGKRRLPGFSGEWVEKTLDEIGIFNKGCQLLKNDIIPNGKYACIHYGELFTKYKEVITHCFSRTSIASCAVSKKDDILFPASDVTPTGLGRCSSLMIDNVILGGDIIYFRHGKEYFSPFLSYAINHNRTAIITLVTGTTVNHISSFQLKTTSLSIPPFEKQIAIATILSDMDAEIDALTAKLNKAKHIKQGMMSELLTGRIRLLETKSFTAEQPKESIIQFDPKETKEPSTVKATKTTAKGHSQQFDDAVMIAGIVNALYDNKYALGRKKVQKCLYLLRRYQDENTAAFKRRLRGRMPTKYAIRVASRLPEMPTISPR